MDRGVWWATVHGIAKSRTLLSDLAAAAAAATSKRLRNKITIPTLGVQRTISTEKTK